MNLARGKVFIASAAVVASCFDFDAFHTRRVALERVIKIGALNIYHIPFLYNERTDKNTHKDILKTVFPG